MKLPTDDNIFFNMRLLYPIPKTGLTKPQESWTEGAIWMRDLLKPQIEELERKLEASESIRAALQEGNTEYADAYQKLLLEGSKKIEQLEKHCETYHVDISISTAALVNKCHSS